MIKMIAFVVAFLPSVFGYEPATDVANCTCDVVTNLHTTFQTSNAVTYAWDGVAGATQYKVWYVRKSDQYTSAYSYTSANSFNFTGLAPGQYSFHFVTVCGGAESNIGIDDMILD